MSSPSQGFMFKIRPTRVSIVDRPANKRMFLVTKSQENGKMDEIIQIITETEADNEEALVTALKSSGKDDGTVDAVISIYRTLNAYRESITEEDLGELTKALEYKAPEGDDDADAEAKKAAEEAEAKKAEDDAKAVAEEAEAKKAAEEAEEIKKAEAIKGDEVETLRAKVAELEGKTRRDELSKLVAGLRVGKTEDELVDALKSVEDAGGKIEPLIEVFKAADANIRASLGEIGSDLPGQVSEDVYGQLESHAHTIMSSSDTPMRFADALKKAGDDHPELMTEYYK